MPPPSRDAQCPEKENLAPPNGPPPSEAPTLKRPRAPATQEALLAPAAKRPRTRSASAPKPQCPQVWAWRIWSQGAAETREASQPASKHPFSGPGLSPLKLPAPNNSRGSPATHGQELCFEEFRDSLKSGFNGCNWLWNECIFSHFAIFFLESTQNWGGGQSAPWW